MAAQKPPRQFGESFVPVQLPLVWRARADQRVGELLATTRATANDPFDLRMHGDEPELHRRQRDPRPGEMLPQLDAGEKSAALQRPLEDGDTPIQELRVHALLAQVGRHGGAHPWRAEPLHPGDVLGGDEVPRRPHHVGPENRSVGKRLLDPGVRPRRPEPQPERPLGERILLRLDGAEVTDEIRRGRRSRAGDALAMQPQRWDVDGHLVQVEERD